MSEPAIKPEVCLKTLKQLQHEGNRRKQAIEQAAGLKESFRKFVAAAWETVEPAKKLIPTWSIDAIADHLDAVGKGQIQNLLANVCPGSCKSILCSVMFPAWMWTRDPGWRSMHASYEATLSTRDSVRCRDLIKSIWYQETFEPQWKFATDQDEKTYFYNTSKGFRISTSVGGRGTGLRAHHLGIDDPLSIGDQFSDAKLEECLTWYDQTWYNRLIELKTGTRVLIMQRVNDRDLSGHLLRRGGWEHLCIPMEYDPARSRVTCIGWKDPRTRKDELMSPEVFPRDVVDETRKTLGESAYHGQYQQTPAPDGGGILKSHKWNYWAPASMLLNLPAVRVKMQDGTMQERRAVARPEVFDLELTSWDMAFKDLKTSDYVAGMAIGIRGADRFVLKLAHGKMDLPASVAAVRSMAADVPRATLHLVEDKANGPAVIQSLRHEISGMVEVNPEGGKVSRASASTPELEAGNWYLPHPMIAPWVGDPSNPTASGFLAESVLFPFGANDDMVDAWSQAAVRISKERIGGVFGVSESTIKVPMFDLKQMEKWPRIYGFSVTWRDVSAVWITRQPGTNQHYLYAEYDAPAGDPTQQAAAIRKMAGLEGRGVMTAKIPGREEKAGYAIARQYVNLGLHIETMPYFQDSDIIDLTNAFQGGKLKVCANLQRFFDSYRMFRRNPDTGKLPDHGTGVIMATLVAWRARDKMREPSVMRKEVQPVKYSGQGSGWMSS